ncbi:MAG: hypothetical protein PVF56_02285 [Desulfobacterales bacterium]|jgi:hypothetical protein
MKPKIHISGILLAIFYGAFIIPGQALATQGHGGIEGVYVHQFAHLFFIISMASLIYWLRERGLVREKGWKYIQYSAFFFILWNLDTMLVHMLDDQFNIIQVESIGTLQIQINDVFNNNDLKIIYYLAKLDHLLCVPAIFFLYIGLKQLLKQSGDDMTRQGRS